MAVAAAVASARLLARLLPEVEDSSTNAGGVMAVSFRRKVLYTAVSLLVFLVAGELLLYGVQNYYGGGEHDPRYWMNAMSASLRPTVMALGLVPLLYSEMVVHLCMALKIIGVHDDRLPDHRRRLERTRRLFAMQIAIVSPVAIVLYASAIAGGTPFITTAALVFVFQLIAGGLIAIYLDDLLRKGYGFLSGLSLFSAANCCACIFWKALNHAYPWMMMLSTLAFFLLVLIILGDHHITLPPMLSIKYGETNKVVNMLGIWKEMRQYPGHYWPVSGIASYITTPLTVCSRSKRYLVRLLKKTQRTRVSPEQLLQEHDEDESISPRRCRHYMTMAAYIVGICVGLLNLLAGFMGLGGSGPAIMLAVTVIHNLVEGRNTGHVAAFGL
uniref:Uncharacterized protein n=1 Tax=Oryza rufipogon TaxID=4529 RepID=A0A0E0RKA1_ORYRU